MLVFVFLIFAVGKATASDAAGGWMAPWPENTVYYDLPLELFKPAGLRAFDKVFQDVEANTCITVKPRNGQPGYVKIGRDNGKNRVEHIGYRGAEAHNLWIKNDEGDVYYAFYDTILHEFLHALGLQHEQFQSGREYDWPKAFENLRTSYKCTGSYPRDVPKRPRSTGACEDDDVARCEKSPASWTCSDQSYWKDFCAKTCLGKGGPCDE